MTASGQLSRPPAGTLVTAYGQSLVSAVTPATREPAIGYSKPTTYGAHSWPGNYGGDDTP